VLNKTNAATLAAFLVMISTWRQRMVMYPPERPFKVRWWIASVSSRNRNRPHPLRLS
jgi:hypothetical protein